MVAVNSWIAMRTTSGPQASINESLSETNCVNMSVMGDSWDKNPEDWVEEMRIVDAGARKPGG